MMPTVGGRRKAAGSEPILHSVCRNRWPSGADYRAKNFLVSIDCTVLYCILRKILQNGDVAVDHRRRSLDIIERAEQEVLSILAEEATAGRYEGIDFARLAALRLRDLRIDLAGGGLKPPEGRDQGLRAKVPRRASGKRTTNRKKKGQYPKFQILDGALVKVGWSKKEKAEYHQRIPEATFNRVISALGQLAELGNGSHPSDKILETIEMGGEAVPSYQTYAVLRFLRDRGAIRMPSRGEYVIPTDVAVTARTAFLGTKVES